MQKMEVDLTPKMSSQLQSGFIQVVGDPPLLAIIWFSVTTLVQSRILGVWL